MNPYQVGPFSATFNDATSTIVVTRGKEALKLFTGECAQAKSAVKMASSMLDVEVMPPFVSFSPFKVYFRADGSTSLGKDGTEITFSKADYEDLISIIDMSMNACADALRIHGGARAGVRMSGPGEPVF
jgi:hypothetical protein